MIVEKKISELQVGHYVVDIVEQEQSFSLTQSGHIKSDAVINNLVKKGVKSLLIDVSKTITLDEKSSDNPSKNKLHRDNSEHPVILEIAKAKKLFNESKEISQRIFLDITSGRDIDTGSIIDITDKTIDVIFKNPDALACVINLRNKDDYLLEHSVSVSVLMTMFSRYLDIDRKIVHQLAIGAFLHDIGKIFIDDEILNKPGKLTEAEFEIMKSHVNHSIEIIKNTPDISELSLEMAAMHHEKLDASGYPFGITSAEISQYGRMITICDIFDALTANRSYKDGYSQVKSFGILRHLASIGQLDSTLVDSFIKCIGVYPVGSLVELSSNKLAIVEGRNDLDPTNPKVRSFYNSEAHHYVVTQDVDLSRNDDFIIKGVRADDFDLDMNKIVEFLLMEG